MHAVHRPGAPLAPVQPEAFVEKERAVGVCAGQSRGGNVRSLVPAIEQHGIATAAEIGTDTFERRLRDALGQANAVVLPPTVVGAWGAAAA